MQKIEEKRNPCSLCGNGMSGWICNTCFVKDSVIIKKDPIYGIHPEDTRRCVERGHKDCICANPELKEYRDVKCVSNET